MRTQLTLGVILAATIGVPVAAQPTAGPTEPKDDALGFRWQISAGGVLEQGTNLAFAASGVLSVNGTAVNFQATSNATPTSREFTAEVPVNAGKLHIERRATMDAEAGVVRFVDRIRYAGASKLPLAVEYSTHFPQPVASAWSDLAALENFQLTGRETGVVVSTGRPGTPAVAFHLGTPHEKLVRSVQRLPPNQMRFKYEADLLPGRSLSFVHGVAQRYLSSQPAAKELAMVFLPFQPARFLRDLTPEQRGQIVNGEGAGLLEEVPWLLEPLDKLTQRLSVVRGDEDLLVADRQDRLSGTLQGGAVAVTTRFGRTEIPFEEIAAVRGAAGGAQAPLVHLRSGEVLVGGITLSNWVFRPAAGVAIPLDAARVDHVFRRVSPTESRPPPEVTSLVELRTGDRVALVGESKLELFAATAWGRLQIPLADVREITGPLQPQPLARLVLADGSRLSVMLRDEGTEAASFRFGQVRLSTSDLVALIGTKRPARPAAAPDTNSAPGGRWTLTGDNVLFGDLDAASLTLSTKAGDIAIGASQIRELKPADAADAVSIVTVSGQRIEGRSHRTVLSVRALGKNWNIPLRHVVEFRRNGGS